MRTTRKARRPIAAGVVGLALLAGPVAAQHPAINLLDVDGNVIDPVHGNNADAPFSTRQTCGQCHDYDTITQGYHFQMGWDTVSDTYGRDSGRPWSLSNGFMGRWYPYAFRQLAPPEEGWQPDRRVPSRDPHDRRSRADLPLHHRYPAQ